jgi:uncharacterized protein (DUF305 family)
VKQQGEKCVNTFKKLLAAATIVAVSGVAFAQMSHDGMMMNMEGMQGIMKNMMPADGDSDSTKAFKQADMEMMQGMAVEYTGNADVDFRLKMIPHHQGAIDMAKVALQFAKDPSTKAMAEAIIAAQEKEIAEMQVWLAANKK